MRIKRTVIALHLALSLVLLLGACNGGSSGGSGGSGPPPATGSSNWDELVWDEDNWA